MNQCPLVALYCVYIVLVSYEHAQRVTLWLHLFSLSDFKPGGHSVAVAVHTHSCHVITFSFSLSQVKRQIFHYRSTLLYMAQTDNNPRKPWRLWCIIMMPGNTNISLCNLWPRDAFSYLRTQDRIDKCVPVSPPWLTSIDDVARSPWLPKQNSFINNR